MLKNDMITEQELIQKIESVLESGEKFLEKMVEFQMVGEDDNVKHIKEIISNSPKLQELGKKTEILMYKIEKL